MSNLCPNHVSAAAPVLARWRRKNRSRGGFRVVRNGQMVATTWFPKNATKPEWVWWFWCVWGANNEAFVDFSVVLLMFRETWFGSFWRVLGPMGFHDFRVCDFAWFYCGFWMVVVFRGGLKGWNFDPRGGFKAKVDNQDSTSWGLHFGGSARAKIMKCHGFKNAWFSLRILKMWCFWGAIWMVCKKSPPPYGAKNQNVNITKEVCKKSPPESLPSLPP